MGGCSIIYSVHQYVLNVRMNGKLSSRMSKKYVQDNKNATMVDVCDQCNVEPEQLRQWIREERLQFADDSPIKISCERCGAMIGFGRFCNKCKINLSQEINSALKPVINETSETSSHPSSSKMRFL